MSFTNRKIIVPRIKRLCEKCNEEYEGTKNSKYCDLCKSPNLICARCKQKKLSSSLKYCDSCRIEKNKEDYERHKECSRKIGKKRYYKNRDKEEFNVKRRIYMKEYYNRNKEKYHEWAKKIYEKNKEKHRSRGVTLRIFSQLEKLPICSRCGSKLNVEIHHEEYPLKVTAIRESIKQGKIYFLCRKCHGVNHRK